MVQLLSSSEATEQMVDLLLGAASKFTTSQSEAAYHVAAKLPETADGGAAPPSLWVRALKGLLPAVIGSDDERATACRLAWWPLLDADMAEHVIVAHPRCAACWEGGVRVRICPGPALHPSLSCRT